MKTNIQLFKVTDTSIAVTFTPETSLSEIKDFCNAVLGIGKKCGKIIAANTCLLQFSIINY